MQKNTCAITGYGPDKLPFGYNEEHTDCDTLKQKLIKEIVSLCHKGYRIFYIAAEMSVGIWSAEIVLSLQIDFNDLKLIYILPYEGCDEKWSSEFRERHNHIIEKSSNVYRR